jgi:hypothetical protein
MGMVFSDLASACIWLYVQGYRQNETTGDWLKGKKIADIRRSPVADGVVCVVVKPIE